MRVPALGLGVLLLLSACTSADSSSASEDPADGTGVLVDMDVSPGDLDALRILLADEGVHVAAVSLTLTGDLGCEDGTSAAAAVLDEAGHEDVPVVCGPDEQDDEALSSVDQVLVLGPLPNVASMLGRLSEAPIIIVAGPEEGGAAAGGGGHRPPATGPMPLRR